MNPISDCRSQSIDEIFSRATIHKIPMYQRNYKWELPHLEKLIFSLREIADGKISENLLHMLSYTVKENEVGDPKYHEVVDGQQRFTTIYLLMLAFVKWFAQNGEENMASQIFGKYIIFREKLSDKVPCNYKLYSNRYDRRQLTNIVQEVMKIDIIEENYKFLDLKVFDSVGAERGRLTKTFGNSGVLLNRIYKEVQKDNRDGLEYIKKLYNSLVYSCFIITTEISSPRIVMRVYDSINSGQEKVTTGELFKNFIFQKTEVYDETHMDYIHDNVWMPFEEKFKVYGPNTLDQFCILFAQTLDSNATGANAYEVIRDTYIGNPTPEGVVGILDIYSDIYFALKQGNVEGLDLKQDILDKVKDLSMIRIPDSAMTFLFKLLHSFKGKHMSHGQTLGIMKYFESYFLRRNVLEIDSTAISGLFRRLWSNSKQLAGKATPTLEAVKMIIENSYWSMPSSHEFKEGLKRRVGSRTGHTKYILMKYDQHLGGNSHDLPNIECVLPRIPNDVWSKKFSDHEIQEYANQIGNMLPVVKGLKHANVPFHKKKKYYKEDAIYWTPKNFNYESWDKMTISQRTKEISDWAVKQW